MGARGLRQGAIKTILAAALLAGCYGCRGDGGGALVAVEEGSGLGSGGAGAGGETNRWQPSTRGGEEAGTAPRRGGGAASSGPVGFLPVGPLFQPPLGSGTDVHSAECDPFDDPFGACI